MTEGTPRVAEIHPVTGSSRDEVLRWAAGVERHSEHPAAAAILAAARDRGLAVPDVDDFLSTPGRGVQAVVDGRRLSVGSPILLDHSSAGTAVARQIQAAIAAAQAAGHTAVVVLADDVATGVLVLADRIRADAAGTVAALHRLTGTKPVLLTGDNPGAARHLAAQAAITDVHAELLPQDKIERVRAMQAAGGKVLVVGDGVNDAPALAAADLGVAMGRQGADLALQSADAVLVRDDLAALPTVIALSRRARRLVKANLAIAATFITVLVAWDLFGHLPLPVGVAGHEGSTIVVGLNGLRLLTAGAWRRARTEANR